MTPSVPPVPQRPFATSDDQLSSKPVYRVGDDPLPFSRDPRLAAIDVMILIFSARLHIEHLNGIGICPEDVADLIRRDLEAIERAITPPPPGRLPLTAPPPWPASAPPRERPGHFHPRLRLAATVDEPTPSLFDAAGPNVGETGGLRAEGARVAPP